MKSFKEEIKKVGGVKLFAKACEGRLIKNGYVYNPVYGWEKPENLEKFSLNPNMKGVPCYEGYEMDYKTEKIAIKDEYGNKTGKYEIRKNWYWTDKKTLLTSKKWLAYQEWKRERWEKYDKEKYAQEINTPPVEFYNEF